MNGPLQINQERVQNGLLARLEAVVLRWLAGRIPEAVGPDHMTLLGFFSMVGVAAFYFLAGSHREMLHAVNFCLLLNWAGDSLDGTLARFRKRLRPRYGFYVDHLLDSVGAVMLFSGMTLSGLMSERVATGLMAVYLLLSIHSYLAAHTLGIFRISFALVSPTELRLLLALGNLIVLSKPLVTVWSRKVLLFDVAGCVAIGIVGLILLASTVKTTRQLYEMERV